MNLFGALTNGRPVSLAISAAAASAKPGAELMPVPTAVPPSARRYTPFSAFSIRSRSSASMPAYPDHSCPRVRGVASCMCVRPILTMSFHCSPLAAIASCSAFTAGMSRCFTLTAAAMFIAEGKSRWTTATC